MIPNTNVTKNTTNNIDTIKKTQFTNPFSQELWEATYRDNASDEKTIDDTFRRVSKAVASVEKTAELKDKWEKEFYNILSDFNVTVGGRIYANAGTKWAGTTLMNCFSYDTPVITDTGIQMAGELSGKIVNVLTKNGEFKPAEWKNYGIQKLYKVIFENGDFYNTTINHEWWVTKSSGGLKKTTTDKLIGERVPLNGILNYKYTDNKEYIEGVRHGLTFGDGNLYTDFKADDKYSVVNQFGDSRHIIVDYFDTFWTTYYCGDKEGVYYVKGLPAYYKEFPTLQNHTIDYLRGFLAGYIGADGCVDNRGSVVIHCADKEVLEKLRELSSYVGIPTLGIRLVREHNPFDDTKKSLLWMLTFVKKYIQNDEKLLIKNKHREYMKNSHISTITHSVKVVDVIDLQCEEDVFCCNELSTHTFTIGHGYLTGNCFVGPKPEYDQDSLDGILHVLRTQSQTLKSEGGWGMNFSFIRPRGSFINGVGVESPGSIKYMELFDKSSDIVTSGSGKKSNKKEAKGKIRKGAMMGVQDVWHPDIEEFIDAKKTEGRLNKFNLSVNCSNEFMDKIIKIKETKQQLKDLDEKKDANQIEKLNKKIEQLDRWDLIFPETTYAKYKTEWDGNIELWKSNGYPVKIYKTISAMDLWNKIMTSTYNRNDPGVLFLDIANKTHCWNYGGKNAHIAATNPCIIGETLIAVADGRNAVSIKTLAEEGKDVPVYSTNLNTGRTEIKWGRNPRKTGEKLEVWKLTLDDGSHLIATPNHKILKKDLTYCELKDLSPEDSIMSFYSFDSNNYRQISNTGQKMIGGSIRNRRQYRLIHEFYTDKIVNPKKYAIHHKNFNSKDDNINNLEVMLLEEHKKLHSDRIKGKLNPYYKMTSSQKFKFASHSGEKNPNYSGVTNEELLKHGKKLFNQKGKLGYYDWKKYAKKNNIPWFVYNKFRFKFWTNFKNQVCQNHKVVKVEHYGYEDVYNITVDDNHNYHIITKYNDNKFITSSGICIKNCGEQCLPFGAVCNLASLNLVKFINKSNNGFDLDKVKSVVKVLVRFLDNINELTNAPLNEYLESIRNRRRIGCGILGWGSALYLMKVRFGSDEAESIKEQLMKTFCYSAIEASIDLAEEKGMFKDCIPTKHAEAEYFKQINLPKNLIDRIKKSGIRNSSLFSIQPTGNTSLLANNVSGGLEPIFLHEYIRTTIVPHCPEWMMSMVPKYWEGEFIENKHFKFKKEGEDTILYAKLLNPTNNKEEVYKIDKNRGLTREILCEDYAVKILKEKNEWNPKANWAVTTEQLSVDEHVRDMTGFGKWIDSSMSKTVNVPNSYSYEKFKSLYINAYKTGYLKGITTYRAGTMMSVLSTTKNEDTENKFIIHKNNAPKRPKDIKSELHLFTVGKHKYYTSVGLDDNGNPYEVFTGFNEGKKDEVFTEPLKGINRKLNRGEYIFIDDINKEKFSLTNGHSDDTAAALTRMISSNLRHGASIDFVVHQLEKTEGSMLSFSKVLARTLKKYIKNGTVVNGEECPNCNGKLVRTEGCATCINCSWSKCS